VGGVTRVHQEAPVTARAPTRALLPRLQQSAVHAFTPLQRELHRFFEDLGEGWDAFNGLRMAPVMDAVETKSGLELTLELPGLTRDEITLTVDEDLLTVSGEKKSDHDARAHGARVLERSYGEFSRSIYLPRSVDGGKIEATMTDGVLKILAPRRPEIETKTIPIRSA
jgi:HSP20 family protein